VKSKASLSRHVTERRFVQREIGLSLGGELLYSDAAKVQGLKARPIPRPAIVLAEFEVIGRAFSPYTSTAYTWAVGPGLEFGQFEAPEARPRGFVN
jgi:hypothetical protein